MTTTVECFFATPEGVPIANAEVDFQPAKSSFLPELDGIVMPRPAASVTDSNGKCTVELWPSDVHYFVRCADPLSDAEVFYRVLVPLVSPGVVCRLQDLTVTSPARPFPSSVQVEMHSDTQLKITRVGADGVLRTSIVNLP